MKDEPVEMKYDTVSPVKPFGLGRRADLRRAKCIRPEDAEHPHAKAPRPFGFLHRAPLGPQKKKGR